MSPVPEPADNHQNPLDELEFGNHVVNIIAPGSSSEEEEATSFENGGYQPLPQGSDSLEEEEEEDTAIDYSSLSGLLSALNTHGPNVVDGAVSQEEKSSTNNVSKESLTNNTVDELPESSSLSHSMKTVHDNSRESENLYVEEQAVIWNSTNKSNEIEIDESKENEIKSLMSKITLPNSAVPSWAKEISEEEWKSQISSRIFGSKSNKNDQS